MSLQTLVLRHGKIEQSVCFAAVDAVPPEDSSSFEERMRERFRPAPEPPLKIRPSSRYQFRIDSMVSSTARMKHALTCCGEDVPTLNHTGELKLNTWCRSM